jgi:hypothetical protein
MVVTTGATFAVQAVEIGANQVPSPVGDATYVTCGPFECAMGLEAPEITIANSPACQGWDPMFALEVGMVDNDRIGDDTGTADIVEAGDGYDLGWVYSSSLDFSSTHDFGTYTDVKVDGADGTDMGLAMKGLTDVLSVDLKDADGDGVGDASQTACMDASEYGTAASDALNRPRDCFRLHVGEDYLANYNVSLSPTGAGVDWGSMVEWETDPFEDLTCEDTMPMMAAEDLDVCSLFAEEVEDMHAKNTGYKTEIAGTGSDTTLTGFQLKIFGTPGDDDPAPGARYNSAWYHDGTKGGTKTGVGSKSPLNLYRDYPDGEPGAAGTGADERGTVWVAGGWIDIVDDDGDPMYGDLGKVDIHTVGIAKADAGADVADNYPETNTDARKCSADDGGAAVVYNDNETKTVKTTGSLCDAEDVEIETSVVYTDHFGDQACSVTKTYALTCQWDASGERGVRRGVDAATAAGGLNGDAGVAGSEARFLSCKVE